ncbi:hypothetical protein M422DRAFT_36606 [Sphaerobolus stellatus SS14]|uniref:DUF6593 domain-containing protein n=1 Tax=Sphaerobolus stellatus (strain SS14) TaxID=990650 RepID=A0A0C9UYS1_SPHS4|nr:hypothetical protein M422DRAFT_36606 [Sphaerobolus stellatus SS14]
MLPSGNDCYDLYFFGEGQVQNNPRHTNIIGYEGDHPMFFQFFTILSQSSTQTRIYRDQREVAKLDWTAGTHLGMLTIGRRQVHMGQLLTNTSVRSFNLSTDGTTFEWRRTQTHDYELYSPGNRRIATYSRVTYQTRWGACHGLFRYSFKSQDALLLEALISLCLNRWIDMNNSL